MTFWKLKRGREKEFTVLFKTSKHMYYVSKNTVDDFLTSMILNFQNMKKTSCELATCFYIHIKLFLLHIYLHLIFAVWNINFDELDFFPVETKNANLKLHSQINCLHSPRNHQKRKCYDPCLYGRAEILVIFDLHFGRNDDLINSFWI